MIRDFYPLAGTFRPGQRWRFAAEIEAPWARQAALTVNACRPRWNGTVGRCMLRLERGLNKVELAVAPPDGRKRGYIVEIDLDGGGNERHRALTAVDVLDDWRLDPRYGFLSEFAPEDDGVADRVRRLGRFHINCIQFYDWMYRHYQLLPPGDEYKDALGRRLSLSTVRRAIQACHRAGMAALAYAAVYAAEPEFSDGHKQWGLFDVNGRQHSLAGLFFLMDLGDGSWPDHVLKELRLTLKTLRFDGFHLDQYGYPGVGYTSSGKRRDVARDFARFIARAARVQQALRPQGALIFNCVDAWPLAETSRTPQAATYIEVWKPYRSYADLFALVTRAQDLAPRKPVIIAAYPSCLREKPALNAAQASATLAFLAAVVLASGAWPLLVGEGDRVLADAYYPNHIGIPVEAESSLREILDLGVAAREFLRDTALRPVERAFIDGPAAWISMEEPISSMPQPGRVWVTARERRGCRVISLLDLAGQTDDGWDRPHAAPQKRRVQLSLAVHQQTIGECWVMSPGEPPLRVTPQSSGRGALLTLDLKLWALVVVFED